MSEKEEKIEKRMTRALKIAYNAWSEADIPYNDRKQGESGKNVALANLAIKIYDELSEEEREEKFPDIPSITRP